MHVRSRTFVNSFDNLTFNRIRTQNLAAMYSVLRTADAVGETAAGIDMYTPSGLVGTFHLANGMIKSVTYKIYCKLNFGY